MINQKIALSAISIATSLSLMAGATFAFFSDSATSSSNTFSTGSLQLSFADDADDDTATASFTATGLVPGACTGLQTLNMYNNGTIPGDVVVNTSNVNDTLAPFLRISAITFDAATVPVPASTVNNAWLDFADLEAATDLPLGSIGADSGANFVLSVCLDESADGTLQGLTNDVTFTFTLNQQ